MISIYSISDKSRWSEERLQDIAELRTSNVDKKSAEGEQPVRLCNYVDVYKNDKVTMAFDFMEATATKAQIERFNLQVGDVVITKDSESPDDIGIPALIAETAPDLVCGYHLTILRPFKDKAVGSYLFYALKSRLSAYQFYLVANGVTRFGLTYHGTKNIRVALPLTDEQRKIAAFLDWKTGQIDALIAKKQALLEKLKEKRLALITQAVTKGLNPNAPLKDSGIPWLGNVPQHWEVTSVRRVIRKIEQGWSPECFSHPAELDEWGVLKAGCVNRGEFNENENKALPSELDPIIAYEINKGDVLVSRANGSPELVGSTAYVHKTRSRLMLSDKTFRIHLDEKMLPRFFVAVFNSRPMRSQIESAISGADGLANNLPKSTMLTFQSAIPPLNEQTAIIRYLDAETGAIDMLSVKINSAIARLTEYRTALITAATTGKIDVRNVKIPPRTTP
ncbi:type I restriction enzyme S subunit [Ereboglobus sp. PH5-5]|uniref:restriction endonuclease subunit S n=1 Tax=Ereboglobus sp. PH5-5 TaxID=2940529 RepID=UPI0024056808|nr:restriction endonuclease subunit S [Ereboglobus sp. PH5-5]MDF9833012.1 type I restriction enzyme S subunit [Ereboglobus sp. PH5-5]